MDEANFDIFAGAPEEQGLWIETVEGLLNARKRMGQIAAQKPGKYFLFSGCSQSILTRIQTFHESLSDIANSVGINPQGEGGFYPF